MQDSYVIFFRIVIVSSGLYQNIVVRGRVSLTHTSLTRDATNLVLANNISTV